MQPDCIYITIKQARELRGFVNRSIFDTLLYESNSFRTTIQNYGFQFGNPDAKSELIKFCSPFCNPCTKAHSHIKNIIITNNDIRLRISYYISDDDDNIGNNVVNILLG